MVYSRWRNRFVWPCYLGNGLCSLSIYWKGCWKSNFCNTEWGTFSYQKRWVLWAEFSSIFHATSCGHKWDGRSNRCPSTWSMAWKRSSLCLTSWKWCHQCKSRFWKSKSFRWSPPEYHCKRKRVWYCDSKFCPKIISQGRSSLWLRTLSCHSFVG